VRLAFTAILMAGLAYVVFFWQPKAPIDTSEFSEQEPMHVDVPQLDQAILAQARDGTREERLFLEREPLRHLLEKSLNVSPPVALELGMPEEPVPLAELRAHPGSYHGRWLWYRGTVEDLSGPKPGHPVAGYQIWEATLRLPDGDLVLHTFTHPPGEGVRVGGFARAEGFLLKLRDLTVPRDVQQAPLLVGASLLRDYEYWGPVAQLEPERFLRIIDARIEGDRYETTQDAWRSIDQDQAEPLWHLGAYARDHAAATLTEWRRVPALNAHDTWSAFKDNAVPRGTPMRVLGTLVKTRKIAAEPNPAMIKRWTEAWVQVADLNGKTIPFWIPKEASLPIGTDVELRGYYFRRFAYESRRGQTYWTPLFVAADLEKFEMRLGPVLREVTWIAFACVALLIAFALWNARGERRRTAQFEAELTERRRRRRLRAAPTGGAP
jgi:hypothetical protein